MGSLAKPKVGGLPLAIAPPMPYAFAAEALRRSFIISTRLIVNCKRSRPHFVWVIAFSMCSHA